MILTTVPKLKLFFLFPYMGNLTCQFIPTITKELTSIFPYLQPKLVFTNPITIGSFFTFKDVLPPLLKSRLVYRFTCPRCDRGTYIGSTKRMFKIRIDEHRGVSYRTNLPISHPTASAIRTHCFKCRHKINYKDFSIISSTKNNFRLLINESIEIKQTHPTLNSDVSSIPLCIT